MDEKRKLVRFNMPIQAKYRPVDSSEEFSVLTKDISMGGARIVIDKDIQIKDAQTASISFLLPDRTLSASAKVSWVKGYEDRVEVGISFVKIEAAHKEDIYNHIFKYHRQEVVGRWWQN